MLIIRPIAKVDLAALLALADKTGVGMTTLAADETQLTKRIDNSVATFAGTTEKADAVFMFVLEDSATGAIAGTCAIAAAVGLRQAFYSYRVGLTVNASEELGIYTKTPTLFLSNDYTGNSELCSLFLDPGYRGNSGGNGGGNRNGSLLSKCRLLFIAQFRDKFAKKIIAELRGISDENGRSPFWDGVGRHFFSMEFSRADYLTGIGKKSFVAELMPKHPLYSSLLSPEAQEAIGKTHELTRGAQAMLEDEGFHYDDHVDIFDAGPAVECETSAIGAVAASRLYQAVAAISRADDDIPRKTWLVSNTHFGEFRATLARAEPAGPAAAANETLRLPADVMVALGVKDGDTVRAVPLSPRDRAQNGQRQ